MQPLTYLLTYLYVVYELLKINVVETDNGHAAYVDVTVIGYRCSLISFL